MEHYDIIVIGSGPAGEGAAMMAAKNHRRVAMIEKAPDVGGGCTHYGTIPSKALRQAVKTVYDLKRNPMLKGLQLNRTLGFPELIATANGVINSQVSGRQRAYDRNRVPVHHGWARFLDPHTIEVQQPGQDAAPHFTADYFILCTGSRPYHPPELDFSQYRVRDSDTVLNYPDTPFAVTIFGAGVIGCEYASIFLNLGCKVTLINAHERLLSFLDEEIADALSYHLREQGAVIRNSEQFAGIEVREHDVLLELKSGRRVKSDLLLWANGRSGNTDQLNLAAAGLEADGRGQLRINEHYQTAVPHIYAAGDVAGPPALASAGYVQGSAAAHHIVDASVPPLRLDLIPTGIYTLPEISSVGLTEKQLREKGVPYEIGHAAFRSLARAQMTDERTGMLKILFHTDTLEILGVHCFGDGAAEIIHIGQMVMSSRDINNLRHFVETTFNYPTMAEAYRVAAYNGLNRLA